MIVYFVKQFIYTFKKKTKTGTNLRHLVGGLRHIGGDQNQMMNLLTLGITQQTVGNRCVVSIIYNMLISVIFLLENIVVTFKTILRHLKYTSLYFPFRRKPEKIEQLESLTEQVELLKNVMQQQGQQNRKMADHIELLEKNELQLKQQHEAMVLEINLLKSVTKQQEKQAAEEQQILCLKVRE